MTPISRSARIVDFHVVRLGKFSLTWSCGSRQRDTTSSGWKFRFLNLAVKGLRAFFIKFRFVQHLSLSLPSIVYQISIVDYRFHFPLMCSHNVTFRSVSPFLMINTESKNDSAWKYFDCVCFYIDLIETIVLFWSRNTATYWTNADLLLGQCGRRRPNSKPTLDTKNDVHVFYFHQRCV